MLSRRLFLRSAAVAAGFAGLRRSFAIGLPAPDGELVPDPAGLLDLPPGFTYHAISTWGEVMSDGLRVPARHDGMGAFAGPDGLTILMRNHEVLVEHPAEAGPFGANHELLNRVDQSRLYDLGHGQPHRGGVTTLVYDTARRALVRHALSLGGTSYNCAGGVTPWGTWLSCEEWHANPDALNERPHGYVFEVPVSANPSLVQATPLPALGRFRHEAVAVEPKSGCLYLTEDIDEGLLYRFLPNTPGRLANGGRLQALAIRDERSADLRNWLDEKGRPMRAVIPVGTRLVTRWIDLENVDSPIDDLRYRGYHAGACRFARAEGIWHGRDAVYIACTSGGPARLGQIWKYIPSPVEGTPGEESQPAFVELFIESTSRTLLSNADNITVAPDGTLFACEDGEGRDRVVIISPDGSLRNFASNRYGEGEFCGAVFSPDGTTLFVNFQVPGVTFAITGPWPWQQA